MEPYANGLKCHVVEWMKINNLKWFGHLERKKSEELVKFFEIENPRKAS